MFDSIPKIPVDEIKDDFLKANGVKLLLKREDLIHEHISGNKWRKLKYNLIEAKRAGYTKILTFGGAFSNHIAATAAAGKEFGFETVGIIRGENLEPLNPTLQFCKDCGMEFIFITREAYRNRFDENFMDDIKKDLGKVFIIPEGGANVLGIYGCEEILEDAPEFDVVACACGTGSTMAGLIASLKDHQYALGFPSLKMAGFLTEQVQRFLFSFGCDNVEWHIELNYHFGGYAKQKPELIEFIQSFWKEHKIKLDPIYTAKMMYGIYDLVKKGELKNKTILAIHTGGLQGVKGFEERYKVELFS